MKEALNNIDDRQLMEMFKKFLDQNQELDIYLPLDVAINLKVPKVEDKSVYRGFYLNPQLSDVLDDIAKKKNKKVKSDIVNIAIKDYLIKEGILQKNI